MPKQSWVFAFALVSYLTAVSPVVAAEWWYVGKTEKEDSVFFVDRESVRTASGGIGRPAVLNAWTVTYMKDGNGKYFRKGLQFRAEDCSDGSTMLRQFITYKSDGAIDYSSGVLRSEWEFVIPDSIGQSMHNFVCNYTKGAGEVVEFSAGGSDFHWVPDPEALTK